MPGPRIRAYARPKKGTIKRLVKSLWKYFKLEIIISLITLFLSILVNLNGSIFASLITQVVTNAVKEGASNVFTGSFEASLLNVIPLHTNLTQLLIALSCIYGLGVICSWTWTRTMAVVTQKYLNIFRIKMFSHMQKLPIKYFDARPPMILVLKTIARVPAITINVIQIENINMMPKAATAVIPVAKMFGID